jgi:Protein of unknown function (DUF2924)
MNLADEITALAHLTVPELRGRYAELFGEATRAGHKVWLIKRLAWRLQALAEGDLSERARQRALDLARDADLRLSPPQQPDTSPTRAAAAPPPTDDAQATEGDIPTHQAHADRRLPLPGAVLTRVYKGQRLEVTVLARGFAFAGTVYRSLSAVAKAITGSHCNGFHFFRLTGKEATP